MAKILASGLCALALLVPHTSTTAADVFWVPVSDGQVLSFLQSGTILNSDGSGSSWGPERIDIRFEAVDLDLLDHHADWRMDDGDSRYNGTYLAQTARGLERVAEGNPSVDATYRYYTDPQPWLYLTQPLTVGVSVSFSGQRRGRWDVPGGGTEGWSGTWNDTYLHLGHETVTTPLGTFDALKLQIHSVNTVDTRELFPFGRDRGTWDETRWFVPGMGYVKVEGAGRYETDFNGDGTIDRWQDEMQTMVAIPEPATAWSLLAGLAMLSLLVRRRQPGGGAPRP